jgi:hypothetical protein
MIFEDRKTVRMTFCMLGKSGEAVAVRDNVEEDDEDEEEVDECLTFRSE